MADQPQLSAGRQITNFMGRLSTVQKATIAGVALAVIAGIVLMLTTATEPDKSVLFSDLEQKDAAQIVEKLKEKNIAYDLKNNGTTIMVPAEKIHELRLSLASEGLPQSSVVGYEIFDKTNLGMSDFVQKLNYRRALEGELSRTIQSLEEVHKARVHIVIPEKALFTRDQKKPSGSVILQLKGGRSVSKLNVEGIQNLVASSVEGMEPADVSVVDQKGQILSEPPRDKNSQSGLTSTQYEIQQKIDQYLTSKAQTMLDGVLGAGNAVVRVSAELDFQQIEKTKEEFDPDGQVVRSEQKIDENSRSTDSLNVTAVNTASQRGNVITNYEITKTIEKVVNNGGGIKRLTVAAMVNGKSEVVQKDGAEPKLEYKPRTQEEMDKFSLIIKNAVGYDPTRNDQVSVQNLQFDNGIDEEDPRLQKNDKFSFTYEDIAEKGLIVLAMLIAIWMIRKLMASPQVRRRIEQVLAPAEEIMPELAVQAGPAALPMAQQLLLPGQGSTGVLINKSEEDLMDEELLRERARQRLALAGGELTEEVVLRQEMKSRVQEYVQTRPEDAVRLVKMMLSQDDESKKRGA
jgi:flagellar M-ring protein FliF